ncbi:MAG: hypothetical protein E7473_11615 [Ruminococcaceae bacterium]|nr:hypothetical protein [Oscillospiraceae bacterium]
MVDNKLYFGAAKEIITPKTSETMIGFATMFGTPFTDIHDDLFVRTLALRDTDGETVILMSYDLLFHDDTLSDALRDYIAEKYGISKNNLHVSYTHTHFGPAVKGYDFVWYTEEYEAFLLERAKSSIDRAIVSLRPGTLKYAAIRGEWNISRRFVVEGDVEFKPSPDGECDKNLYLLRFDDETGKMRALLMNFACHPSNLSAYSVLSSEYPGRLCQRVESEFYGCTALFFQGFGSDAKLKIGANATQRFNGISYEDCDEVALSMTQRIKVEMFRGNWQTLPVSLGADVFKINIPLIPNPREYYMETKLRYAKDENDNFKPTPGSITDMGGNVAKFHWARADYVLDNYDSLPDYLPLNCGAVRINPDFYIFSMGGEPGCNIGTVLREAFPDKTLICLGYNDAIAYVASDKMIAEGGYEAGGRAIDEYRLKGEFKPGVDELYKKGFSDAILRIEDRK